METLHKVVPVLVMAFGWSYAATTIPILKFYVPGVVGFGGFGIVTFVGIYLAARTCRYYEVDRWMRTRWLCFAAVLSGVMCWFNFMHNHSPFALVFAGSLFLLFKRLPLKDGAFASTVLLLSPSMFSVYLLHMNSMGMAWLRSVEDKLIAGDGCNYYLVCLMVAVVFFVAGVILDLPRRLCPWGQVRRAKLGWTK